MVIIDFYAEQGTDFNKSITLNDDVTGYAISSKLEDSVGVSIDSFCTLTDDSIGKIDLVLSEIQTSSLSNGVCKYTIELTSDTGKTIRVAKGRIYIDKEL